MIKFQYGITLTLNKVNCIFYFQASPVSSPTVTSTTATAGVSGDNSGWDNGDDDDDNWGSLEETPSQMQYVRFNFKPNKYLQELQLLSYCIFWFSGIFGT